MFIKSFSKKLFSHKYIKNKHILRQNNIAVLEGKKKKKNYHYNFYLFQTLFFFCLILKIRVKVSRNINMSLIVGTWIKSELPIIISQSLLKWHSFFFFFNNSIITLTGRGIWALKVSNEYTKMYQLVVIQDSWQLA